MNRSFILSVLLLSICFTNGVAFAKTTVKETQYSVGLSLTANTCKLEDGAVPKINGLFEVLQYTTRTRGKTTRRNVLNRRGNFLITTRLSKLKLVKNGFEASGKALFGSLAVSEKITVGATAAGGTAQIVYDIVVNGARCQVSYAGNAIVL